MLFDLATARLVERKVLLPGATTLERLVARVRERAARRLWDRLVSSVPQTTLRQLEALLAVRENERTSAFDQLRQGPTRISGPALLGSAAFACYVNFSFSKNGRILSTSSSGRSSITR